jgi:hypothetical protein
MELSTNSVDNSMSQQTINPFFMSIHLFPIFFSGRGKRCHRIDQSGEFSTFLQGKIAESHFSTIFVEKLSTFSTEIFFRELSTQIVDNFSTCSQKIFHHRELSTQIVDNFSTCSQNEFGDFLLFSTEPVEKWVCFSTEARASAKAREQQKLSTICVDNLSTFSTGHRMQEMYLKRS